jgi:signal transduction histidine kinase
LEAVASDPLKIRRVLDNLILNALEAIPEGGTLTVRAWREGGEAKI